MPLNDRKIIGILLEEGQRVPDRCPGYREEIVNVISDVITYERGHRVDATNIQQKINDKFDAAARFLTENRAGGANT